jgi:ADP-heptose:LPS heptosyltransferase
VSAASRVRRRLDRRVYGALAALYRGLLLRAAPRGPADPAAVRRVLVVRHDRLGDYVVTTPLLAFLREALPHAEIDLVASPGNAALAHADPRVAAVVVNDHSWRGWWRARRACRARGHDLVLSPIEGRGLREGLAAVAFAPPHARRVTTPRPKRYLGLFTHVARGAARRAHMAERVLAVGRGALALPAAFGPVDARRYPYALGRRAEGEARAAAFVAEHGLGAFVAANAWAVEPHRDVGEARMAELLALLAARHPGLPFVLVPAPAQRGAAAGVAQAAAARGARVLVYPPSAHVLDVVSLFARAAALVTPDTGLVHLAAAAGCPVLGLYSPRSSRTERWTPLGVPGRAVAAGPGQAVADVPLAAVADAFGALWSAVGGRARGSGADA